MPRSLRAAPVLSSPPVLPSGRVAASPPSSPDDGGVAERQPGSPPLPKKAPRPGSRVLSGGRVFTDQFPWFTPEQAAVDAQVKYDLCHKIAEVGDEMKLPRSEMLAACAFFNVFAAGRRAAEVGGDEAAMAALVYASGRELSAVMTAYWDRWDRAEEASRDESLRLVERVRSRVAEMERYVGVRPRLTLPVGRLDRIILDTYGNSADPTTIPGADGAIAFYQMADACYVAIDELQQTAALMLYPPMVLAGAAFWLAHRCLRVGMPLVSRGPGRGFEPWHEYWGLPIADVRAAAMLVVAVRRDGSEMKNTLAAWQPRPRRVNHSGGREKASAQEPSCNVVCEYCKVGVPRDGYAAHRVACKFDYVMCAPCGHVHKDEIAQHVRECLFYCEGCGEDTLVHELDLHLRYDCKYIDELDIDAKFVRLRDQHLKATAEERARRRAEKAEEEELYGGRYEYNDGSAAAAGGGGAERHAAISRKRPASSAADREQQEERPAEEHAAKRARVAAV